MRPSAKICFVVIEIEHNHNVTVVNLIGGKFGNSEIADARSAFERLVFAYKLQSVIGSAICGYIKLAS